MANNFDVKILSLPLGSYNGATDTPLAYLPTGGGDQTILSAYLTGPSAGTAIGGKVITMSAPTSSGGTPTVNGTIGAFAGTVVTAAGAVFALTISDAVWADGEFLGYDQASGTVPAGTNITVAYITGIAGS